MCHCGSKPARYSWQCIAPKPQHQKYIAPNTKKQCTKDALQNSNRTTEALPKMPMHSIPKVHINASQQLHYIMAYIYAFSDLPRFWTTRWGGVGGWGTDAQRTKHLRQHFNINHWHFLGVIFLATGLQTFIMKMMTICLSFLVLSLKWHQVGGRRGRVLSRRWWHFLSPAQNDPLWIILALHHPYLQTHTTPWCLHTAQALDSFSFFSTFFCWIGVPE